MTTMDIVTSIKAKSGTATRRGSALSGVDGNGAAGHGGKPWDGMNGIAEGVRQVRGSAVNQVPDVEHVLVTAGTGVPTSGIILRAD